MNYTNHIVIDEEEINDIINNSFFGDHELFSIYHVINDDIESAIKDTFFKVKEIIDKHGGIFLKICKIDEVVGYANVIPSAHVLHSFGIKKSERNADAKNYLMGVIDSVLGNEIYCNLYCKNTRAVEFLKSYGYVDQQVVTLLKK